ncbi:MAG: EpsI family protein [Rhodoferax ferrireducens]|uniref:EpsI family protein n=2 Tax=Pseudomonadota TaxID=1224 RepID=A0A1Y1R0B1_9GAMM|nr:MAG: EpsI family protein [Rhodoferax ferrireducens]OQX17438.1 MAG: EpsI family protein [Thiothrix lacustris]
MLLKNSRTPALLQAMLVAAVMLCAAGAANKLKPTQRLSELKPRIELAQQVPKAFGNWAEDLSQVPVLPDPQVQARLDVLYSSTLARTYRNTAGQRVMLSIAYGSDQSSEATSVHRPEFCYSSQGFNVSNLGESAAPIGQRNLTVQRLRAVLGQRREPITYWITLDETATLPGIGRKLNQLRFGLRGQIPDGLLFRVSSIDMDDAEGFKLQEQFLNDLAASMEPSLLKRYFGS